MTIANEGFLGRAGRGLDMRGVSESLSFSHFLLAEVGGTSDTDDVRDTGS